MLNGRLFRPFSTAISNQLLGWELTEKNLKKARRKIKNKISAQESRKRKRDYVNNLEERISDFTSENQQLKRDLEKERSEKKTLMSQVTLGSKNRLYMSKIRT